VEVKQHSEEPAGDWIVGALERYEKRLLRYAAWLLDDADKARDVVQEAFLRLCREDKETVAARLPQWLFTVCRNLAFDLYQKNARTESLDDTQILDAREVAEAIEALEQRELVDRILRITESLPRNQREVIYLRFQCGFSYKEISQLTRLTMGNVGFLIHSALDRIRRQVEDGTSVSPTRRSHEV
jgi:RNA polymerase sigma-70 factor (ECF subfamily)